MINNYKKVYFVVKNKIFSSAILRGIQISNELKKHDIDSNIITANQIDRTEQNSIFIWVKEINENLVSALTNNIHIYDPVDNYIYSFNKVQKLLNKNIVDHLVVNSSFMKNDIKKHTAFKGNISTIHHHWDPRISNSKKTNQDELSFGFMGSAASLTHTDNFLHYKELINEFPIEFYDTEIGKSVTDLIKQGKRVKGKHNPNAMDLLEINFNCHFSIRKNDTKVSRYKTTAKLATASALDHNIITTHEKAVADILPSNYPFILHNTSLNAVKDMLNLVSKDYYGDKILWNEGLSIMSKTKNKLSLETIILDYVGLISKIK
jgi:hypothetical protein